MKTKLVLVFLVFAVAIFAAGAANAANAEFVVEAVTVLEENYVDPLDRCELFNAAIDGLSESLKAIKAPHKLEKIPKEKCPYAQDRFVIEFSRAEALANGKLTQTQLAFETVKHLAMSLNDSHVYFLNPQHTQEQKKMFFGKALFAGIGVVLVKAGERIYIKEVIEDTPAYGLLKPFDIVLAIDEKEIDKDTKAEKAVELIRGHKNTAVKITVARTGEPAPLTFILNRRPIKAPTVSSQMLEDKIGYLKIHSFSRLTISLSVIWRIKHLTDEGMEALILDLRGNNGGLVEEMCIISGIFFKSNTTLCRSKNRDKEEELYTAVRFPLQPFLKRERVPVVVLIDKNSASASEIMAAAMQEYGRAVLVGEKTAVAVDAGTTIDLPEDTSLMVTVERIITSKGVALDKIGVTPDVVVPFEPKDYALGRDPQLLRALEIIKSKLK